jgi:hypothetical protein
MIGRNCMIGGRAAVGGPVSERTIGQGAVLAPSPSAGEVVA